VGKTIGAATTDYVVDLAATLPVVISDTDALYLYGLDIIAEQLAGADRYYYVHDELGSVRQLVDSTGQIATRYAYDPFGVPLAGDGVPNPWQFTGEAWDAGVELLYLRARYYQPETGRFITRDPWTGDYDRPATLHLYGYARSNPVNVVDPSGFQACGLRHCQPFVVDPDPELRSLADELRRDYAIIVGEERYGWIDEPSPYYLLWSNWRREQLELVKQAASDFAGKMEGAEAAFRAKVGPVPLYKREAELVVFWRPRGGWSSFFSVTLPGVYWDHEGGAWMKATIVHELAHWWDYGWVFGRASGQLTGGMLQFWTSELAECLIPHEEREPAVPIVREWREERRVGGLNPREDWANAVVAYVYPDYAEQHDMEISEGRWYYVAELMNPGKLKRFPYPIEWRAISFWDTRLVGERGEPVSTR
jgi:RHS repeat-associated protein